MQKEGAKMSKTRRYPTHKKNDTLYPQTTTLLIDKLNGDTRSFNFVPIIPGATLIHSVMIEDSDDSYEDEEKAAILPSSKN